MISNATFENYFSVRSENQNTIFSRGDKTSADYFTGTSFLNVLVPKDETGSYTIGNVEFEPACRTNWHTHPAGQILLVTNGKGYYQEKGKSARLLEKGDVVVIPSHIEHWHGATPTEAMTHIAIGTNTNIGGAVWLLPVTDEEHNK